MHHFPSPRIAAPYVTTWTKAPQAHHSWTCAVPWPEHVSYMLASSSRMLLELTGLGDVRSGW